MLIEFVNHAAFIVEAAGQRLVTDPWLDGRAFDDSWGLLAPSVLTPEDFASLTHVWFSHEHPDHFHPPTLKRVPPEVRARLEVLYQTTADRKVLDFCAGLGFGRVRELPSDRWVELASGFEVMCSPQRGFADSWLCVRAQGRTLLDLNDCDLHDRRRLRAIREQVGPIDVLATQFSISAWDGNAEDLERRRGGARKMLERTALQCEELRPRHLLPIASFIWFCHEENAYMNDGFLPLEEVVAGLSAAAGAEVVVLYPGDRWRLGEAHDNRAALERYALDEADVATRPRTAPRSVPPEDLMAESRRYCRTVLAGSDALRLKLHLAAGSARRRHGRAGRLRGLVTVAHRLLRPEECNLFVPDHRQAYAFHPLHGLHPVALAPEACDVSLSSAALHYAFRFLWGGETLLFNGRFHENRSGARLRLFDYFHLAGARNSGAATTWRALPRGLARRLRGRLAQRGELERPD